MKIKYEEAPTMWASGEIIMMFVRDGIKFYVIAKDHPGRAIIVVREYSQIQWSNTLQYELPIKEGE